MRFSTPVTRINWASRVGVELETAAGPIDARAAIVTASTGVISAGKLTFAPELPWRHQDAIERLKLGSYDHITLELAGQSARAARGRAGAGEGGGGENGGDPR